MYAEVGLFTQIKDQQNLLIYRVSDTQTLYDVGWLEVDDTSALVAPYGRWYNSSEKIYEGGACKIF